MVPQTRDGKTASCMSRVAMLLLVLATVCKGGAMCQTTPSRDELRKYLTPDGSLQALVVLRDGQDGFAGVSGEIWTIEPKGHFSMGAALLDFLWRQLAGARAVTTLLFS